MRYVIEFGVRGGNHSGEIVLNSKKTGAELAAALVHVFRWVENEHHLSSANRSWWGLEKNEPRKTWTSSRHFVALSWADFRSCSGELVRQLLERGQEDQDVQKLKEVLTQTHKRRLQNAKRFSQVHEHQSETRPRRSTAVRRMGDF